MAREIEIQLGEEKSIASLMDEQAPSLCNRFWNTLPFEVPAHHAKICNHEIMAPLPVILDAKMENSQWPVAGDIGWWDGRNSINIWYADPGPSGPLGYTSLFAKVTRNLAGLEKEGLKLWRRQGAILRISKI